VERHHEAGLVALRERPGAAQLEQEREHARRAPLLDEHRALFCESTKEYHVDIFFFKVVRIARKSTVLSFVKSRSAILPMRFAFICRTAN
jgi:hypothetical protein